MRHRISSVEEESIAYELGILPGDFLLMIDGNEIIDIFDYRINLHSANLLVEIEKAEGEVWELDIEKEYDEDIGLVFESPLMSPIKLCENKCIFCFVDQEPMGLRKTLYVKDDDWRLSFLQGNFVTLTNVTDAEATRIAKLHLSPLYISVHAACETVRRKMMNFRGDDNLFHFIHLFGEAGIEMHFQIVLCKGINDGDVLTDTLIKLKGIKGAKSIAIVPAGLTKHRLGLYPLESFTSSDQIPFSAHELMRIPVYMSDEWYMKKHGSCLPAYETYNDFPQLSNGVGMTRLFEHDFKTALNQIAVKNDVGFTTHTMAKREVYRKTVFIVTGVLAESFIRQIAFMFEGMFKHVQISVFPIANHFYGDSITVSGLLTGGDIICQLNGKCECDVLFLPENAFRTQTEEMIDGMTLSQIKKLLNIRVLIGSQNGSKFFKQLYEETIC